MNRKMIVLTSVFLVIGLYYALSPIKLNISAIQLVHANEPSIVRAFADPTIIAKSFGSFYDHQKKKVFLNGIEFELKESVSNLLKIDAKINNTTISTFLNTSVYRNDTSALNWFYTFPATYNPITRWKNYQTGKTLQSTMKQLLASQSSALEKTTTIYGFDIKEIMLSDTVLITTRLNTDDAPTNAAIYQKVFLLEQYAKKFNKKILNNPMITMVNKSEGKHVTMIGLSIDGEIPSNDEFAIRLMPPHGKMFITEVIGGPNTIAKAYQNLHFYQLDANIPSPALPFELLLTDRLKVTDTAQWHTRVYFPVMKI